MDVHGPLALVTCLIDMRFAGVERERAVALLLSVVGRTQAKSGCRECTVARDATEEDRVRYGEVWCSEPAFRRHLRSQEFHCVLMAMDMACEEPQVTVGNLAGRSGMAYLSELRGNVDEERP